jgi:hypothetical protein
MARMRTCFCLAALVFASPLHVSAQEVVVRPRPGAGEWTVHYTRMFDKPDSEGELDSFHKTLASAKRAAADLQRWSATMENGSQWKLTKIYIDGEDAKNAIPKPKAPPESMLSTMMFNHTEKNKATWDSLKNGQEHADNAIWVATLLSDPEKAMLEKAKQGEDARKAGAVLKDYADNVSDAYKRVKETKEKMLTLTQTLTAQDFKKMNDLVATYNKEAANFNRLSNTPGGVFPMINPVGPETVKQVGDWRNAVKRQFELEERKEDLDLRKTKLDAERSRLADEWKALAEKGKPDPANAKVVALRERLKAYTAAVKAYDTSLASYNSERTILSTTIQQFRVGPTLAAGAGKPNTDNKAGKVLSEDKASAGIAGVAENHLLGKWYGLRDNTCVFEPDGNIGLQPSGATAKWRNFKGDSFELNFGTSNGWVRWTILDSKGLGMPILQNERGLDQYYRYPVEIVPGIGIRKK